MLRMFLCWAGVKPMHAGCIDSTISTFKDQPWLFFTNNKKDGLRTARNEAESLMGFIAKTVKNKTTYLQ